MADDGGISPQDGHEVTDAEFVAAAGLVVAMEPITRFGRTVGARISVRTPAAGQVVPARLGTDRTLRGLPVPAGPGAGRTGRWALTPRVTSGPASAESEVRLQVQSAWTDRSGTIDVTLPPSTTSTDGDDVRVVWQRHWLQVHIDADADADADAEGDHDHRVSTWSRPLEVHRPLIGIAPMAVFAGNADGRLTATTVVLEPANTLHSAAAVSHTIGAIRELLDSVATGAAASAVRVFDEVLGWLGRANGNRPAELVMATHDTAVLPRDVTGVAVFGGAGDIARLVVPSSADDRCRSLIVTVGPGGVTIVRDLSTEAPASTPVQQVQLGGETESWLSDFAPLLHFVRTRDPRTPVRQPDRAGDPRS